MRIYLLCLPSSSWAPWICSLLNRPWGWTHFRTTETAVKTKKHVCLLKLSVSLCKCKCSLVMHTVYPAISPKAVCPQLVKIAAKAGLGCMKHKNGSWKATVGTNVLNLWQNWNYNFHKHFPRYSTSPATHLGLYWTKHWAAFLASERKSIQDVLAAIDLPMSLRFHSRVHPSLFTAAWAITTGLHKPTWDHTLCCLWALQFCYYTNSIAK